LEHFYPTEKGKKTMSKRQRRTKNAAEAPASYAWTPEHPAHKPDPNGQDYMIGDGTPSTFAEDVHQPPYHQSAAPASYDWEADHPAAAADAMGGAPSAKKAHTAAVKKASKCVDLATYTLGKNASEAAIERQALMYMDLPDTALDDNLQRFAEEYYADAHGRSQNDPEYGFQAEDEMGEDGVMAEDHFAHDLFDEYDADGDGLIDEDEFLGDPAVFDALDSDGDGSLSPSEVDAGLPGFSRLASLFDARMAYLEDSLKSYIDTRMAEVGGVVGDIRNTLLAEEEAMLAELTAEAGESHEDREATEQLEAMFEETEAPEVSLQADEDEFDSFATASDELFAGEDESTNADDSEIMDTFWDRLAAEEEDEKEEDEKEEDEKEEDEKEEKGKEKKASSPKPPKPSRRTASVSTLGNVGGKSADEDLSALWSTKPDVSDHF
jgi:hypothetical protein